LIDQIIRAAAVIIIPTTNHHVRSYWAMIKPATVNNIIIINNK
jgi:hypothetical protein